MGEFNDFIKSKNISGIKNSDQQYHILKMAFICTKYGLGLEDMCVKKMGLIFNGRSFVDYYGNKTGFETVCKGNQTSPLIERKCSCGRYKWAC